MWFPSLAEKWRKKTTETSEKKIPPQKKWSNSFRRHPFAALPFEALDRYNGVEWLHPFGHNGNWYRAYCSPGKTDCFKDATSVRVMPSLQPSSGPISRDIAIL